MEEITVKLPKLGDTVDGVLVLEWLVAVGDRIEEGADLLVVETDKITTEVPAPAAGTVGSLLAEEGTEVAVGEALCTINIEAG